MKRAFHTLLLALAWLSVQGQCILHGTAANSRAGWLTKYESSGDGELDRFFIAETELALSTFSLKQVDLYFYDDSGGPNAFADPRPAIDQTVYGIHMIRNMKAEFPNSFRSAWAAIVAHEMGHIKQFQVGNLDDLEDFQVELHADFLAGYYIGYQYTIELASEADAETFFDLFYRLGDTDFFSEDHHGSHAQRRRAAIAGWKLGKLLSPIQQIYYEGKRYVKGFRRGGK